MPLPPVVPISALAAQNLTPDAPAAGGGGWYPGRTLLEEIDALEPADRRESKGGAQLCVNDVYRSLMLGPATVSGTLQAGTLSVGQPLMLLPGGGTHTVKALASRGEAAAAVTAGDHVELSLAPPPDEGSLNDVRQGLAGALAKLSTLEGRQLCGNQTVCREPDNSSLSHISAMTRPS